MTRQMTRQEIINEAYRKSLELCREFAEYRFDEDTKITEYDIDRKICEIMKLIGSVSK